MAKNAAVNEEAPTLADLVERLGDIPLDRIRTHPPPGTATEDDVVAARDGPTRLLCELIDGTLVEKPMGTEESLVASLIVHLLWSYLDEHKIGKALGEGGMLRL